MAATGHTVAEFEQLLPAYQTAYQQRYPSHLTLAGKERQRQPGGGSKGVLAQAEERVLFILIYLKTNPLQTMHGLQFGLSQSQANYWIHHLLPVVQVALREIGMTPARDGAAVASSPLALEGTPDLALDGTERRRQRPQDAAVTTSPLQRQEKDAHRQEHRADQRKQRQSGLSGAPTEAGSKHDKKAADEGAISYPSPATLDKDTGFQGYEPTGVLTRQPKKSRGALGTQRG